MGLLSDAYTEIRKYFPLEKLSLEVVYDSEFPSWKKLFILILVKIDASEAFRKLSLLDENWWLDASLVNVSGKKISIDIDFA